MPQVLWFAFAWIAGTAAILGSLMTLGSVLLLLVPSAQPRSHKVDAQTLLATPRWQNRLRLLAFSAAIATVGLGILIVVPFPSF